MTMTVYAPINTTIDGDRDYGMADRQHFAPGAVSHLSGCIGPNGPNGLNGCNCPMGGFYQGEKLTPGMLGELAGQYEIPAALPIFGAALLAAAAIPCTSPRARRGAQWTALGALVFTWLT